MPIDINLLDVWGQVQDRVTAYKGPPVPTDPIQAYRYLHRSRQVISQA